MNIGFYPRMAATGMRKNGRLYIPYLATCILMVAMFYIVNYLGFNKTVTKLIDSGAATDLLQFGSGVIGLFGCIFLFYTHKTLIKGRLKEFGVYSVLGMSRRNLARVIFWETVITWAISLAGGLASGIALSKLAELGFMRMTGSEISYSFNLSLGSIFASIVVFTAIFFLIFLSSVRHVGFVTTIGLIRSAKAGEKAPKANYVIGILGVLLLLAGYYIALSIKDPLSALLWFFVAVILVILGTYLTFIAGSVMLMRLLSKNKKYYYKAEHFVSVSSMAYRMRRNGAGLASICILITMVLVMLSCTSSLYMNVDDTLVLLYPYDINAHTVKYGYEEEYRALAPELDQIVNDTCAEYGISQKGATVFTDYYMTGYFDDATFDPTVDPTEEFASTGFKKTVQIYLYDLADYNRLTGKNISLSDGEILAGVRGDIEFKDTIRIAEDVYNVKDRVDREVEVFRGVTAGALINTLIVVTGDVHKTASLYKDYIDFAGDPMIAWDWYYGFDAGLDEETELKLASAIQTKLIERLDGQHMVTYCASKANERESTISTFGGFLFLGILLSIVFLVSCVLIIYYKQISEGYEDQSRFDIMQKVGMTKDSIKKSINSQMLTVFLIPIIFASLHLACALPLLHKLLMLFGFNNMPMLIVCCLICVLICALIYTAVYKLTSNAYYRIVA
ncbi:MAG: ABC transporter permease [Saccharofermentans sp.]|nr:ABC transporter permease [Saccharofermentans sp.]